MSPSSSSLISTREFDSIIWNPSWTSKPSSMTKLRSDSPICRRIVLAFLDFIRSVEPPPGVDLEGLDVVKDCLEEVFKVNTSNSNDGIQPGLLADLFSSEVAKPRGLELDSVAEAIECTPCTSSSPHQSMHKDQHDEQSTSGGISKDELFGKFYAALDRSNFFLTSQGEVEDPAQVAKATRFFDDAYKEMEKSQMQIFDLSNLAEALKLKGNQSMQLQLYSEAAEIYTCAIALDEKNAVYYCNRAAAYTQINRYDEAIEDCLKSIEIDPSYSKAYSRLGLVYYAQGKYDEALSKGFLKALQLDPDNNTTRNNIQLAQQKLMERHQRAESDWNTRPCHGQGSSSQQQATGSSNSGTTFTSFSTNAPLPPDLANLIRNMAASASGYQTHPDSRNDHAQEPEIDGIRVEANVNLGDAPGQLPGQMSDVLRTVMGMFTSQFQPENNRPPATDES
ncbi:small glutamine-rich tetratricopeptide repeat-containing protein alpha protein [Dioscorea alata]|uniref:Small glutamine-rich tetratricopeptide repeat-containing protein alpha protein n=1 Tax=Dioscorea alata TaxID=55571 RepID=A0ACB7USI1_DIOAL|nr:small glutamine-rich tetratricopeptide repeat-containing protein alpha protein [Dioscorea alata]